MDDKDERSKIDALLEKAKTFKHINSLLTIEISSDALKLSKNIGYILGEKVAKLYMAYSYNYIGNYDKALDLIYDQLNYFIKEGFYDLQWDAYNLLGNIFCELGDIEKSMTFHDSAKKIAIGIDLGKKYDNEASSKGAMLLTFNNISENYKLLKDYKEVLVYVQKAYSIDAQFDYRLSKGVVILSLGEIYYLLDDYERANDLAYKALQYLKRYKCAIAEADTYKLIALTLWKKGNYVKADEYFYIAINLNEKESEPNYKIDALINYHEYLMDQDKSTQALDILINACDLSIRYNLTGKVSEISIMLSIFYGNLGDYESSFKYTKLHYQYEKKYIETYNKNIITGLNIKNKMQEIEKENNIIIEKNQNLKLQSQSLKMIVEKISIISELGLKITSTLNEDLILDMLYSSIKNFMDLSCFCIGLYDESNSKINFLKSITDGKKEKLSSLSIINNSSFTANCVKNAQFIIINDITKEFPKYIDEKTYKSQLNLDINSQLNSLMFCPLIVNTKVIGVMTIQSKEKNAFTPYHIEMVKALSSYAAIAINNAMKSMELEKLNQILLSLSEKDSLTQIANRRKFDNYLNDVWNISIEEKTIISLLLIDIDYFKEYNDNFGHLEGDNCLAKVARMLTTLNNGDHFVARYGGDEFVIVLPRYSIKDTIKFKENIRCKMEELNISHKFSKVSNSVTVSIGISSIIPNKDIKINELIGKADDELYIVKRYGRNQVLVK